MPQKYALARTVIVEALDLAGGHAVTAGQLLGLGRSAIYRHMRARRVEPRRLGSWTWTRIDPERLRTRLLAAYREAGCRWTRVASLFGVSGRTVRHWRARVGLESAPSRCDGDPLTAGQRRRSRRFRLVGVSASRTAA